MLDEMRGTEAWTSKCPFWSRLNPLHVDEDIPPPLKAFVVTRTPWFWMLPFTPPHVCRRYKNLVCDGQNVSVHSGSIIILT